MPEIEFVLQMTQPGVNARGSRSIRESGMLRHPLHHLAPGKQVCHPSSVLCSSRAGVIIRQMRGFPRTESRTDLIPILQDRVEVAAHPSLEIAQLTDFRR